LPELNPFSGNYHQPDGDIDFGDGSGAVRGVNRHMQVKAKGNTETEEEDDEETTSEDDIKEAKKTAKKLKEAAAKEEAE